MTKFPTVAPLVKSRNSWPASLALVEPIEDTVHFTLLEEAISRAEVEYGRRG